MAVLLSYAFPRSHHPATSDLKDTLTTAEPHIKKIVRSLLASDPHIQKAVDSDVVTAAASSVPTYIGDCWEILLKYDEAFPYMTKEDLQSLFEDKTAS